MKPNGRPPTLRWNPLKIQADGPLDAGYLPLSSPIAISVKQLLQADTSWFVWLMFLLWMASLTGGPSGNKRDRQGPVQLMVK